MRSPVNAFCFLLKLFSFFLCHSLFGWKSLEKKGKLEFSAVFTWLIVD